MALLPLFCDPTQQLHDCSPRTKMTVSFIICFKEKIMVSDIKVQGKFCEVSWDQGVYGLYFT